MALKNINILVCSVRMPTVMRIYINMKYITEF